MANNVRHGKRLYKQMSLEVAVRNPERYEGILTTFAKFDGTILDDEGILNIYSQLYLDGVVTSEELKDTTFNNSFISDWIIHNCSHNNEWGYPTGYQAAFTRYLKTLSEFGFIYAQYNRALRLSPVAKALVSGIITLSEAFALQCMRFWRKSPYRRVLNDYNFFEFIIDSMIALKKKGHRMSYNQMMVGLFSDDGNVDEYLKLLENNKVGDDVEKAYSLVRTKYSLVDSNHAKVAKLESAFRDYGNTVFRVLQLTGFVTVDYSGILLLSPNENRMPLYMALKGMHFSVSESAKEDEEEYFEQLGYFDASIESLVLSHREKEDHSTAEYNKKIPRIIESFELTPDLIVQALKKVSKGDKKGFDTFWFIQDPVKFEFLLTLFVYTNMGDDYVYKPNYICDESGIPYSHAPGNIGDIEVFNKDKYWLIEATLIRTKNQQVNNETVNLFRHIDDSKSGNKYLTLVAPYIHDDTRLIFKVASIITLLNRDRNKMSLNSTAQTTEEFVSEMSGKEYFDLVSYRSQEFIVEIKNLLNEISLDNEDAKISNDHSNEIESSLPVAAENVYIYGSIPIDLPQIDKEDLLEEQLDLLLMYAVGGPARARTERSGKIALGLKESQLSDEQEAAYRSVKYLLFHYWSNPKVYRLIRKPLIVDKVSVPNDYLIRQEKNAVKFLLLDYDPRFPTDIGEYSILKAQRSRRKEIRYMPFVTTLKSIRQGIT